MVRLDKIVDCFSGLIGFSADYDADIPAIDADLQLSRSMQYINQVHDLLSYQNLYLTAQAVILTLVKPFSATTDYKKDNVASYNNKYWRALKEVAASVTVPFSGVNWKETTLLSAYLRKKYNQSVINLITALFNEKKLNEQSKTLLTSKPLFNGSGYTNNAITKTGAFRSVQLTVKNPDTSVYLRFIGLQLTAAQNGIKIYLYHTSQTAPIKFFTIDHNVSVTYLWHQITEEVLAYSDEVSLNGGSFFIGYYEDDIDGEFIEKEQYFDGRTSCGSCTDVIENNMLYHNFKDLITVRSFYVPAEDLNDDRTLWDIRKMKYDDKFVYGLNLQFAVKCDLTNLLCQNNDIFLDALTKQLTVDFLKSMTVTLRNNTANERIAQLAASVLGDKDEPGMLVELEKAKKAVSIDLDGLSKICSGKMSYGYTQKTVWSK